MRVISAMMPPSIPNTPSVVTATGCGSPGLNTVCTV